MKSRPNRGYLVLVAQLILLSAFGCGGGDSSAEQARALLDRIARLDLRAAPDERARRIEQLRALPLRDPQLVRVRDACALAHAGLLAAETEQAAVREKLDQPRVGAISQSELAQLSAQVKQASQRLRDAQTALPECDRNTRTLLERHR